jgi:hypothetical protein
MGLLPRGMAGGGAVAFAFVAAGARTALVVKAFRMAVVFRLLADIA